MIPVSISVADKYGPAMLMTEQGEADAYFDALVEHSMRAFGAEREEAVANERSSLGYYAGYYDAETRHRVEKLFKCAHPIFGKIASVGVPTAEEAFYEGVRWAERNIAEREDERDGE